MAAIDTLHDIFDWSTMEVMYISLNFTKTFAHSRT